MYVGNLLGVCVGNEFGVIELKDVVYVEGIVFSVVIVVVGGNRCVFFIGGKF